MDKSDIIDRLAKSPKKGYKFRQSTKDKTEKNKKIKEKPLASDTDSDSDYDPEEEMDILVEEETDSSSEEEENKEDFNAREFQKFVQKIFPSKSGQERVRQLEKIDEMLEKKKKKKSKSLTSRKKNKKITAADIKQNKKKSKKTKRKKKKIVEESSEDEEEFEEIMRKEEARMLCEDLCDEDEKMDDNEIQDMLRQNMKFNIIFTVGQPDEEEEEEETSEEDEEEEDEKCTETSEKSKKETTKYMQFKKNQKVSVYYKDWDKAYVGKIKTIVEVGNNPAYSLYNIELEKTEDKDEEEWALQENIKGKYITAIDDNEQIEDSVILNELQELIKCRKSKGSDAMIAKLDKMSQAYKRKQTKEQKEREKKLKSKNVSTLRKLLRTPNIMNDFKYFKDMDIDAQKKIIRRLKEVNKLSSVEKPYRLQLLDSDMPACYQAAALKKINVLNYMDPGSGEYYKIKQWVDAFMSIPFGKTKQLPLTIDDGMEKCNAFMEDAKKVLDECVYGLDDAKMQILQLVGNWISNPSSIGTAIAIKGPPGTGKTTLIKEGISKILQRPFAFLALGGATDSSFLEGHGYTYEGSTWGKIVNILIQSKCMNPVIYFDELDKISETPKGEEITGILTHLTDTTQNNCFHDKYFANMDFDLSKSLFIFSYNDESKVNPVLKDRMYRIHTAGYVTKEKIIIAKKYLIPKIEKNVNFKSEDITITDEALIRIIDGFTDKEKGVRNLKRCLEIIYTKLNLYRLMKPDSKLFEKENTINV
ncbi:MAG: AAA family ATPase, partial [Flavobacteriales bacterium]|nr:AAA family ATPase [Flavobacteriales bacterium]